jgi:hypothetical protein
VIVSLFQEAGQKLPGNYRPITLLPVMDNTVHVCPGSTPAEACALTTSLLSDRAEARLTLFSLSRNRSASSRAGQTHICLQDMAKAYDSVWPPRPAVQTTAKGNGRMWHVIRAAYACATSAPPLQNVVGDYFSSRTRRSTGMSPQPYLSDIYIDDLEELNDDHDTDRVPLYGPQARRRLMAVPPPLQHSLMLTT